MMTLFTRILTALMMLMSSLSYGQVVCSTLLKDPRSIWRPGSADVFMAFRSNAPHYWAWARENKNKFLSTPYLIEGLVTGDPHLFNFGQNTVQSLKAPVKLIDLDDSGRAPLLLDLIRFWASVDLSTQDTKNHKVFDAYLNGLKGVADKTPDFILKAEQKQTENFAEIQNDFLNSATENNLFRLDHNNLHSMKTASVSLKAVQTEIQKIFSAQNPNTEILDWAWTQHQSGGSQGMNRIWLLTRKNNKLQILEFKQLADPATAQFKTQSPQKDRIAEVEKNYWGQVQTIENTVYSIGKDAYFMRGRYEFVLNKKVKDYFESQEEDKLEAYSLYLANLLGRLHSRQNSSQELAQILQQNRDSVFESLKAMKEAYVQEVRTLSQQ